MRLTSLLKKLLNIHDLYVLGVTCHPSAIVIQVRPTWSKPRCGQCKKPGKHYEPIVDSIAPI